MNQKSSNKNFSNIYKRRENYEYKIILIYGFISFRIWISYNLRLFQKDYFQAEKSST